MISQEQVRAQLDEFGAVVSPSELHGHFCGRLVVGHELEGRMGQKIAADCLGFSPEELEPISELISELTEETSSILENDLFSFRLMLPDDDQALYLRMEALSEWCQGFLSGLASAANLRDSDVMKQENETINDLVEISRVSLDVEETDESESLFLEVSEYVRLAAFSLFDQFRVQAGEEVSTGADTPVH